MAIYDIIDKKKKGQVLSSEEIKTIVDGYVLGQIPDYQISAWLMAVYFQGMNDEELIELTKCMAQSGEEVDLSRIEGVKVDKHSTGGVGDKVTLAVAPIVAACGGKVAKMSGRGLGFTGGTIDKLEAIPGFKTTISEEDFFRNVNEIGLSVMGQSADIAPADKKMYSLRDVTATVDSIPLIASSIMSKKLAAGSDKIVLDVTVGSGAFMKNYEDALCLAQKMVAIGEGAGRETVAILTNMDVPLGIAAGNTIEVQEAIDTLKGKGPKDFEEICIEIAATMLHLAGKGSTVECKEMVERVIQNGSALQKFKDMVNAQGGDVTFIDRPEQFEQASFEQEVLAPKQGVILSMDTEMCGKAAVALGAGRQTKEDVIDMSAGIKFYKKTGEHVKQGECIAKIFTSDHNKLQEGNKIVLDSYTFGTEMDKPILQKPVLAFVTKDGITENLPVK